MECFITGVIVYGMTVLVDNGQVPWQDTKDIADRVSARLSTSAVSIMYGSIRCRDRPVYPGRRQMANVLLIVKILSKGR